MSQDNIEFFILPAAVNKQEVLLLPKLLNFNKSGF